MSDFITFLVIFTIVGILLYFLIFPRSNYRDYSFKRYQPEIKVEKEPMPVKVLKEVNIKEEIKPIKS